MRAGEPAGPPDTAPDGAPTGPYTRLTVLAPHTRADVALPADVPLGELVPMVQELLGVPEPGARPLPWRLTGVTGGPLPPAATLDELGVPDGELLRLGPVDAAPPPPVFDDPVDALASTAGGHRGSGFGRGGSVAAAASTAAALVLASTAGGWAVLAAVVAAVGALAALVVASVQAAARRARQDQGDDVLDTSLDQAPGPAPWRAPDRHRPDGAVAALAAAPLAAAAGYATLDGGPTGARLLLAVAAGGVAAAVGQALLRAVEPLLVGVVVLALPVGIAIMVHLRLGSPPAAVAAVLAACALVALPMLPRAALRLAGLPRPLVPADSGELMDADTGPDVLPPDELAARAALARGHLAGLVGGAAVLAAGSAVLAATAGGWVAPALAGLTVVVLALRARGFADPAPAGVLLGSAVAAGLGLAGLVAAFGTAGWPLLAGAVLVAAALVAALVTGRQPPVASPVARRATDLLDGLLVATSVPLALGAAGVFELVRALGWLG